MPQPLPRINVGVPACDTFPVRGNDPCRQGSPLVTVSLLKLIGRAHVQETDEGGQGKADRLGSTRELRREAGPGLQIVLLLGTDMVLLETRRDILSRFGYRAKQQIISASFTLPSLVNVALVHICQTIEPAMAALLARRIRALNPGTAILYTEARHQPEPASFNDLLPPLLHPVLYANVVGSFLGRT